MHRLRRRGARVSCNARRHRSMLFRTLGCSGLGFVALISSIMNRAAKESLTSGLRPRVTNAAPPAGLVCRVRSIAQQLRPRALIVASEKLASTMRGGREKTINRCTTVATAASVASSETVSKSNMYSYDHLFMKPPSGTDMKLSGTALILLNTPFDPNLVWLIRNLWGRVNVVGILLKSIQTSFNHGLNFFSLCRWCSK
mmetsp:Transcript_9022/g.12594  ORF Transcript_9022/g.12594 Transcript_9022/m.12594 type:complete len:199 (+) Transcript_9022:186-782(+)